MIFPRAPSRPAGCPAAVAARLRGAPTSSTSASAGPALAAERISEVLPGPRRDAAGSPVGAVQAERPLVLVAGGFRPPRGGDGSGAAPCAALRTSGPSAGPTRGRATTCSRCAPATFAFQVGRGDEFTLQAPPPAFRHGRISASRARPRGRRRGWPRLARGAGRCPATPRSRPRCALRRRPPTSAGLRGADRCRRRGAFSGDDRLEQAALVLG